MDQVEIDEPTRAALGRLTDNEKECLRRRLRHQTAKEMALELGISPHAVEKRLKMARAKLGVSSSLEAARLMAASEGYQRTGPQAADLAAAEIACNGGSSRKPIGVVAMGILVTAIIALAAQSSIVGGDANSSASAGESVQDGFRMRPASDFVDASADEVRAYAEELFREQDKNRSGFVERDEAPTVQIRMTDASWDGEGPAPYEWYAKQKTQAVGLDPAAAKAAYIAMGDANADGKLSLDEFIERYKSGLNGRQVPVAWREQGQAARR